MTIDTPALPAGYEWGFVVGQIIEAIADQAGDADRFPESRPMSGTVRFEPLVELQTVTTPTPAFVAHKKVTVNLNDDGELIDADGLPGVWLVTGAYRVSFQLIDATIPAFPIEVLASHTIASPLDLPLQAPYVAPAGTTVQTLVVPSGLPEGDVLIKTGTFFVGVPQSTFEGPAGPAGPAGPTGANGAPGVPGVPGAVPTASDYVVVGTGRPDQYATTGLSQAQLNALPNGCEYRSTDGGGVGAWVWMKRPTGWVVTNGDTGWRNIHEAPERQVVVGIGTYDGYWPRIRRVGVQVYFAWFMSFGTTSGQVRVFNPITGFGHVGAPILQPLVMESSGALAGTIGVYSSGLWVSRRETGNVPSVLSWPTAEPWPTTLPGSAA